VAPRRAALIGFGLAGSTFHAPLIEVAPGLRLATIVTSSEERARRAKEEYPGADLLGSVDQLWQRASEHELIVVATPNSSHVPLAARAIELGLATVVDKPLATSVDAARALVTEAERRGVPLTVFQNRRWDSDQLTLRQLLAEGALGRVHRYESRFERWRPQLREDAWRETTAPAEGGGVLLDLGSHLVDQALTLFGPAVEVYGEVESTRGGASDDDAFIAITHPDGVRSHLWASSVAAARGPRLRVLGGEAAFVVEEVDGQEAALAEGRRPGDPGPWGVERPERHGRLVRGDRAEPVPSEAGAWPRFYELLSAALDGEGPLPVDPRDAVATLEVLESARRTSPRLSGSRSACPGPSGA
jgi:scyllo-inositol 2-dehydrogenase (NADP+)